MEKTKKKTVLNKVVDKLEEYETSPEKIEHRTIQVTNDEKLEQETKEKQANETQQTALDNYNKTELSKAYAPEDFLQLDFKTEVCNLLLAIHKRLDKK